jgi:CheY-like chemotaxis protein
MDLVLAVMDDLMFLSRIREAGRGQAVEVRSIRRLPDMLAACRPAPRIIFVDLDAERLPIAEVLAALRSDPERAAIPLVGFVSHVHAERAAAARAAGCARVLARSAFVNELPSLLSAPSAKPGSPTT